MKKLIFFSLLFVSSTALMPMKSDDFESTPEAPSDWLPELEEPSYSFSGSESEEDLPTEADTREKIKNSPYLYINPINLLNSKKTRDRATEDLSMAILFTDLLNEEAKAYLDGDVGIDMLTTIDPQVHVNPILDKLLVSNNPKKADAITAIVLNAPRSCYHCPADKLQQAVEWEDRCATLTVTPAPMTTGEKIVSLFKNPFLFLLKPSSIPNGMPKAEIARKIGTFGYFINQLKLPNHIKDEIFELVLSEKVSCAMQELIAKGGKQSLTYALEELTMNDLQKVYSNLQKYPLAEAARQRCDKAATKAKSEFIQAIKLARSTYDRDQEIYDFDTETPKRAAFDAIVKPAIAQILPELSIRPIPGFDD